MVNKKNKVIAFSLAEALISMMIILICVICTAPVLTKQRHSSGLNNATIKGLYACFPVYINGIYKFRSLYCEERNCKLSMNADKTPLYFDYGCKMRENKRPAKYLIVATGAGYDDGTNRSTGQIITEYTNEIRADINLVPGAYPSAALPLSALNTKEQIYDAKTTRYSYSDSSANTVTNSEEDDTENTEEEENTEDNNSVSYKDKKANPGYWTQNGLTFNNIKSIKFLNTTCPSNSSEAATGAKFRDDDRDTIMIEGCSSDEISINDIKKCSVYNDASCDYRDVYGQYKFNIELNDSTYKAGETNSRFSEILSNMSSLRQNKLFNDQIIKAQFGAPGHPGAVVVLW